MAASVGTRANAVSALKTVATKAKPSPIAPAHAEANTRPAKLLDRIVGLLDEMRPSEQIVGRYILRHPNMVISLSFPDIAARLVGTRLDKKTIDGAAHAAASEAEFSSDLHAGADYRRHLAATLVARALRCARDAANSK